MWLLAGLESEFQGRAERTEKNFFGASESAGKRKRILSSKTQQPATAQTASRTSWRTLASGVSSTGKASGDQCFLPSASPREVNGPNVQVGVQKCTESHFATTGIDSEFSSTCASTSEDRREEEACSSCTMDQLSPWERWLLEKEAKRIKEHKASLQQKALQRAKDREEEKAQAARKELHKKLYREWIKKKRAELLDGRRAKEQEAQEALQTELRRKEDIKARAEAKYRAWLEAKRHEDKLLRLKIETVHLEKDMLRQEKQKTAEKAFNEWLSHAAHRKRRPLYSLGYADGTMIRYFDRTANPEPSFCNKNTWIE
ncbi:unnamed protein product [Schistocephalus solidus]|uniref:CCDC34 domain-containing protein n=1 Tax=Schistocephalus solidus TaxID=70667 RepID=A0A183THI2_SCHSO|nr:unnamed protein product [Schistocephalus solidus]